MALSQYIAFSKEKWRVHLARFIINRTFKPVMTDHATSTPLAQLRAAASAIKNDDSDAVLDAMQDPVPVSPPTPPQPIPPPVVQQPAPPPQQIPVQPPQPLPPAAAPLQPIPSPDKKPSSLLEELFQKPSLKLGLVVAIIFVAIGFIPIDNAVDKYAFLQKIPYAKTLLKALGAGVATAAAASSVCKISQ